MILFSGRPKTLTDAAVPAVRNDLLLGVKEIADHLGITTRQVRYARETRSLPVRHKRGFGIYGLKSELLDSLRSDGTLRPDSKG